MGGGWDGEKEKWILWKAPEGSCEIICLPLPTLPLCRAEEGVFAVLRLLLNDPSLRKLLLRVACANSVIYLQTSPFHPLHNLVRFHGYTAVPGAQ